MQNVLHPSVVILLPLSSNITKKQVKTTSTMTRRSNQSSQLNTEQELTNPPKITINDTPYQNHSTTL
jgi:hypothetical protein